MSEEPSGRNDHKATTSVVTLVEAEETTASDFAYLNFRVPDAFHREFKLFAVQHGMTMVDLLQKSFRLMRDKHLK